MGMMEFAHPPPKKRCVYFLARSVPSEEIMEIRNPDLEILDKRTMKHLTVVGVAQMAFNALWICAETVSFFVLRAKNLASDAAYIPRIPTHTLIFTSVVIMVNIIGIAGGYGILRERRWAWRAVIVVSIIELIVFPVGTILGIYSLWILFNKRVKEVFGKHSNIKAVYPAQKGDSPIERIGNSG